MKHYYRLLKGLCQWRLLSLLTETLNGIAVERLEQQADH